MINFTNSKIKYLISHRIEKDEDIVRCNLSRNAQDKLTPDLEGIAISYFLSSCKGEDYYRFRHHASLDLNQVYSFCRKVFTNPSKEFLKNSGNIAVALSELVDHHSIESSDLFICLIEKVILDDSVVQAIAIFKPEKKDIFFNAQYDQNSGIIDYQRGIPSSRIDKGCVVFDHDEENGYIVKSFDTRNLAGARYWNETFLNIAPKENGYFKTIQILDATRKFISEELPIIAEVGRVDQIESLNSAIDYFKEHESFDVKEFSQHVFENSDLQQSFMKYDEISQINEPFDISDLAVKKKDKKNFRVLKLDRNFHVYIHGDADRIVNGVERDGRKFYKLYYEQEK